MGWSREISAFDYLNSPIQGRIRNAPSHQNGTLYPIIGEGFQRPHWHIAQWGIRHELSNITDCLGSCSDRAWQVRNATGSGRVKFRYSYSRGNVVELSQNTLASRFLGCDPAQEFDLFLEPNAAVGAVDNYPGYPEGFIPLAQRPSLGMVTNLHVQVRQKVVTATQGTRCLSPYNLATTVIALVFRNGVTGHSLFYQIISYDSRGASFRTSWFATVPPFYGVNDSATVYGQPLLTPGSGSVRYDIDVAKRVKSLIQSSPHLPGKPGEKYKNPHNWKLVGAYFGSAINGEAAIASEYSEIRIFSD
jgi:hypothetical protein